MEKGDRWQELVELGKEPEKPDDEDVEVEIITEQCQPDDDR
jgi:hypothetical protein